MKHVSSISLLVISALIQGCSTTQLHESFFGLEEKPYIEPSESNVATLTVEAPHLKEKMWTEDKISVSFYNSCTDETAFRSEGYIGSIYLSSNESIGKTKTIRLATGNPIYVEVGYAYQSAQCTNKFRLYPMAGSKYKIFWEYNWGTCSASGNKVGEDGILEKSPEIEQKSNKGGFFAGGSGRTTSEWRSCNTG
jgi:hypothetical protein